MHIDFETKSRLDLKVVGAWKYAKHADIICLAYGDRVWHPGDRDPESLFEYVTSGGLLHAWNAAFERVIWMYVMVPKYKWPEMKDTQWRCTMARAAAMGAPLQLERAGEFFELDQTKDAKGKRVMMKLTKPNKKTGQFVGTVEEVQQVYDYCLQDVRSEEAIDEVVRPLSDYEQKVWEYDQRINSRGIPIDVPLAVAAHKLWKKYCSKMSSELIVLTDGVVEAVSDVKKMSYWICKNGVGVGSMAAKNLDTILARTDLPPNVRRIIEIRKEGGAAATAKFPAMLNAMDEDGRVRGNLQYHAASTGRWGGRIIQPQNLTRGILSEEESEWVIDRVMHQDLESIELYFDRPFGDVLGSIVRPTICAPPGKKFIICDFAAVEARGVAWAAGEKDLVDAFLRGDDVYKNMASTIYHVPVSEVTKDQRFFGKTCLGPDTLVLTDSGWKPIINVSLRDKVWDGIKWVPHDGLRYQGLKDVISNHGVSMTPDHLVLSNNSWIEWKDLNGSSSRLRSAVNTVTLPLLVTNLTRRNQVVPLGVIQSFNANVDGKEGSIEVISKAVEAVVAPLVQQLKRTVNAIGNFAKLCRMTSIEFACSTVCPQQLLDTTIQNAGSSNTMGVVGSRCFKNGETTEQHFLHTLNQFQGGISTISKWIGLTTTRGTNLETSDFVLDRQTSKTKDKFTFFKNESTVSNVNCQSSSCTSNTSEAKSDVYDLTNCGDLKRFTIWTNAGPLLVHNCILGAGYGLGARGFQNQCAGYGVDVSTSDSETIIQAYRKTYKNTVGFWRRLEDAVISTIQHGKPSQAGPYRFRLEGKWLIAKLPSGRDLFYYKPHLRTGPYNKPVIAFTGLDIAKRPRVETTYGGKILENCIGKGAEVLTQSGWKPIELLSPSEKVFDGVDFVSHSGVISKGVLHVGDIHGVPITSDHKVMSTTGWAEASQFKEFAWGEVRSPNSDSIHRIQREKESLGMRMRMWSNCLSARIRSKSEKKPRHSVLRMHKSTTGIRRDDKAWDEFTPSVCGLEVHGRSLLSSFTPCLEELWRSWYSGVRSLEGFLYELLGRHGVNIFQRARPRSERQQRELLPVQLPMGDSESQLQQQTEFNWVRRLGVRLKNWTVDIGCLLSPRQRADDGRNLKHCECFDILNCGPRNCFVVRGSLGVPFVVHNCTQAVCRDILVYCMSKLERAGYPITFHVHDEIIAEVDEDFGSAEEVQRIMSEIPTWAKGFPLGAVAEETKRYKK